MIYCAGYTVSFQEVPDEVSLVLLISDCQHHCPGCHSPELQKKTGEVLSEEYIDKLLSEYKSGVNCVCFMGEGDNLPEICRYARYIHSTYNLKTCLYTGIDEAICFSKWFGDIDGSIDYLKCGEYIADLGGLDSPTTNQRMYRLERTNDEFRMTNITSRFRKDYK